MSEPEPNRSVPGPVVVVGALAVVVLMGYLIYRAVTSA